MTIGAIVVNHDAGDELVGCVASLVDAGINEIIVVDNDSHDSSLMRLASSHPEIPVILTGANLGYGTAVNTGRRAIGADLILICNPDLLIERGCPARLAEHLEHHDDVGVVGPRIYEADGAIYPSARSFPSLSDAIGHALLAMFWPDNRFSRRYKSAAFEAVHAISVDWVSGACMMARAAAFDSVGGFDERYFMYVEDLDLCWRLHRAGWSVAYVPAAGVVHHGGLSASRHPYRMLVAHHVSTWRFARRTLTGARSALLPFVGLSIAARLVVALFRQMTRR